MRALWIADKLGYGDRMHGLGRYYHTVVPALRRTEVIPGVLRATDELARQMEVRGVRLHRFDRGRFDPRTLAALVRVVRERGVDLLHLHGYGASTFGRLAAWFTGRPAIVHQHDSLPGPWYARLADRLLSPLTAGGLVVSESVRGFSIERRRFPPGRTRVLVNAIVPVEPASPAELESFRREQAVPAGARVVGTLTRFREEKGVQDLLSAFREVRDRAPDVHLVLWGDGPDRAALEEQARRLGLADSVSFAGFRYDAPRFLPLLDCFVLPSRSEGLGYAVLEAMVAGRPIVATRVGGVPELVRDGEEALLVAARDPAALAAAVLRVLSDPELALGLAGRAHRASARYDVEAYAAELERFYGEVLARAS